MSLARLYVVLGLDNSLFRQGMAQAMAQVQAFQRSLVGLSTGQALSSLGRGLTYGLTLPIIAAGAAIGMIGSDLASEMARVQSVIATPGNNKAAVISQWTDQVQALGVALGRTSPEVAGGMYEIVSALGEIPNAMEYLEIAGRGAVAGQSDVVTSTKNLVLATRAWGDSSTVATQYMSDLMAQTVKVGTLTESELGGALSGLLPIGRLYNVNLKEMFAGLSSLSGVTGTASQASTQLQRAIISITSPNTALTKAYKALGIASGDALIQQYGLVGAFEQIAKISESTGIPLNKLLGRVEAVKAVASLTGPQLATFAEHLGLLADVTGAVDTAFDATTDGVNKAAFQWAQTAQRMRVIAEDLYAAFAPAAINVGNALQPIGDALTQFAQVVARLDTGTLTNVLYGLLGLAALGPVLTIIGNLTTVFGGLTSVIMAVNPWVWAIAAAGGALWAAWHNDWGGIREGVYGLLNTIQQRADNARQAIENLQRVWNSFNNPTGGGGGGSGSPGGGAAARLQEVGKAALEVVQSLGPARGELSKFEQQVISETPKAATAWSIFVQGFRDSLPTFQGGGGIIRAVGQSITTTFQILGRGVDTILGALIRGILSTVKALLTFGGSMSAAFLIGVTAARSAANGIVAAFRQNWSSIGSGIASGIAGGLRSGVGWIVGAAQSAAQAALSAAKGALGIKSPSSVFRDQVGAMIPAGLVMGIYAGIPAVNQAMNSMLGGGYGGGLRFASAAAGSMGINAGVDYALAGAGGSTTTTEITFGDIIVNGGTSETGSVVVQSITGALRAKGLL